MDVVAPSVGIIMGSQSDWETMRHAGATLDQLGIAYETRIVSAHRTPQRLVSYATKARDRGLKIIIAGAGGAAHLPGMTAAMTPLPVLGVPIETAALKGQDSLLSIVQMPGGVPVGTLAIGKAGAINAALLAAAILALGDQTIADALDRWRQQQTDAVAGRPIADDWIVAMIEPGRTIGILGGGQLGRMTALAAADLGYRVHIYCPEPEAPAKHVTAFATTAAYDDRAALAAFADAVDVVTFEFENVPVDTAQFLAERKPVRPGPRCLDIAQDRLKEKDFLRGVGVATAPYRDVTSEAALRQAVHDIGPRSVLKTVRLGYDGKGQTMIGAETDLAATWTGLKAATGILEGFVDFDCEVSVIVARGTHGAWATYPPVQNQHVKHILDTTVAPARIAPETAMRAEAIARHVAEKLDLVGLLAVEMFVTQDGEVLVNEIAPRPHNSGHWTMDACYTSQFEQLVRAVCGLPLGSPEPHSDAVMKNLLGSDVERWREVLSDPLAKLHLYGKDAALPGRKMGHVTKLTPRR